MKNGVLCPANWKPGEDTLDESYESRDEALAKAFGDGAQLHIKNLDTNTTQPFNLVLPNSYHRREQSSPAAMSGPSPNVPARPPQRQRPALQSAPRDTSSRRRRTRRRTPATVSSRSTSPTPLGTNSGTGSPHGFVSPGRRDGPAGRRLDRMSAVQVQAPWPAASGSAPSTR